MTITCENTEEMVEVIAGLVQRGLTFNVTEATYGWLITLTGGF